MELRIKLKVFGHSLLISTYTVDAFPKGLIKIWPSKNKNCLGFVLRCLWLGVIAHCTKATSCNEPIPVSEVITTYGAGHVYAPYIPLTLTNSCEVCGSALIFKNSRGIQRVCENYDCSSHNGIGV